MEVLYPHCAGLDVHKDTVVACVHHMSDGAVRREVRTFKTMTSELRALSEWLASEGCTHIVMEATGVCWKPVWHILSDGDVALTLANAAHVRNVPGRKTDANDAMAGRSAGAWAGACQLRARRRDTGAARPAAHPQATGTRARQPCPATSEQTISTAAPRAPPPNA
jgi:transposase